MAGNGDCLGDSFAGTAEATTITGALFADPNMEFTVGLAKDERVEKIAECGGVPVIYVTWYPRELVYKNKTIEGSGCLFFDGAFIYDIRGQQRGDMYYAIGTLR